MSEPFLVRNRIKSYSDLSLGEVHSPNELTIKYESENYSPKHLVDFIWLVHERKGLKPLLPFSAYVRHMKSLLKEIEGERIVVLILKAGEVSNYPFTVKLIKRLNEEELK